MRGSARGDGRVGKRKSPLAQNQSRACRRERRARRRPRRGAHVAAEAVTRTCRVRSESLADARAADVPGLDTGAPRGVDSRIVVVGNRKK